MRLPASDPGIYSRATMPAPEHNQLRQKSYIVRHLSLGNDRIVILDVFCVDDMVGKPPK